MTATTRHLFAKAGQFTALTAVIMALALHVLSPEFDPSWRMISEYAFGRFGWVLSTMFLTWGCAEWCASAALEPHLRGIWGRVALVLLVVSGLGAVMGGLFDMRHPLHGAAFGIGVPFVPVAALIISVRLARAQAPGARLLVIVAHGTWIALVVMAGTMVMWIASLKAAGMFHPEAPPQPLAAFPPGVTTVVGYANRFLVAVYMVWTYLANRAAAALTRSAAKPS